MFFTLRRSRHTTSFFAKIPQVKNGSEVTPHRFLFCQKSASEKWQRGCATRLPFLLKFRESAPVLLRSCHPPSFFAENPRVGTFSSEVAPHDFPFCSPPMWLGDSGIASKGIPCTFSLQNASTTWETCKHKRKQNASTPGPRRHSSGTSLPFPNVMNQFHHFC